MSKKVIDFEKKLKEHKEKELEKVLSEFEESMDKMIELFGPFEDNDN